MNRGQYPTTVSVIMACYNAEAFVGESIASIIGQTFNNWELIVVDDASTDGSLRVDGREIYQATDLKVGLFTSTEAF